jgi:hypothetical protein
MTTVMPTRRPAPAAGKGKQTDKALFVANFYPNVWQLTVPQAADIRKVADSRAKAVALPPRGNTSLAEGWEVLLKVNGMKLDDLGTRATAPSPRTPRPSATGSRSRWAGSPRCPRRSCSTSARR